MRSRLALRPLVLAAALLGAGQLGPTCSTTSTHEPKGQQTFTSPQSKPIVLSSDGTRLFVANTTSGSVSVIDTADHSTIAQIEVGLEPSGLALKPDGTELWVSNHLSDTVSVIDLVPGSPTQLRVVETIQDLDANGVTQFDEPVGIAFASDAKAYVALSSRNDVAVVDTQSYSVMGRIHITAQEPRSLAVRNGRLYVAAFESNNKSELSVCPAGGGGAQCTLDAGDLQDFIISSPNIPGADARIVLDPQVPDRDLFVIDTASDTIVDEVEGVGTLLYDLVVASDDEVFITQTDARNEENGGSNLSGQNNLVELQNRMFLNQIGHVDCGGGSCALQADIELEPAPGNPVPTALATPFGIALSDDDSTIVATAAGTSRVFTLDVATREVRDVLDLDAGVAGAFGQQIPKGVALRSDAQGAPETAYVLNTLENTVSVVDVSDPSDIDHLAKFSVGSDPTPAAVRRGRIAFNNAFASTSGTFSCESCHPDGNNDQLLWRIGGPCFFGACTGDDEIRSTMPVRGLRNTLPLHWDGTLGDPFGGINGAVGTGGSASPTCDLSDGDDHDCFMDLVVHSLSGVMCDQDPASNPAGCPLGGNELSVQERDDMAVFLANVAYPPPRSRRMDDAVTPSANQGFSDFFVDVGGLGTFVGVRSCADMNSGCHALPLGADHNSTTLGGFDAPTMRGILDRWLQFSLGITNAEETLEWVKTSHPINVGLPNPVNTFPSELPWDPAEGFQEEVTLAAAFAVFQPVYGKGALDIIQMAEEASTGHSGALGRQVTLNSATAVAPELAQTQAVIAALEAADARGQVNLRAHGTRRMGGAGLLWIVLSYRSDGTYKNDDDSLSFTRAQLVAEAAAGDAVLTFTGALPQSYGDETYRQPLLSVQSTADSGLGNPALPVLPAGNPMNLRGIDVRQGARIVLDGQVVAGTLTCVGGSYTPYCSSGQVRIQLASVPANGLHLLQLQNPGGPLSVEFPICASTQGFGPCK
jgi:YVTN family beta-propeller protein